VLGQLRLDRLAAADQHYLHALLACCQHAAFDHRRRRVVTTHGIENDSHVCLRA